jgi:hypothetical protein
MSFSFVTFALDCRGDGLNNEILKFPVVMVAWWQKAPPD